MYNTQALGWPQSFLSKKTNECFHQNYKLKGAGELTAGVTLSKYSLGIMSILPAAQILIGVN